MPIHPFVIVLATLTCAVASTAGESVLRHVGRLAEDSPIVAMWLFGLRWSELQPYLEDLPGGGYRLKIPAKDIAQLHEFRLPAL